MWKTQEYQQNGVVPAIPLLPAPPHGGVGGGGPGTDRFALWITPAFGGPYRVAEGCQGGDGALPPSRGPTERPARRTGPHCDACPWWRGSRQHRGCIPLPMGGEPGSLLLRPAPLLSLLSRSQVEVPTLDTDRDTVVSYSCSTAPPEPLPDHGRAQLGNGEV